MPELVTQYYQLCGWTTVLIYTEQEMAEALGLTRGELREAINRGDLAYHASNVATDNEQYQFRPETYESNQNWWNCLKNGGHFFEFEEYYDRRMKKAVYKCACGKRKYD